MNRTKKLFQETTLLLQLYEQETEKLSLTPWLSLFFKEMKTQYESLKRNEYSARSIRSIRSENKEALKLFRIITRAYARLEKHQEQLPKEFIKQREEGMDVYLLRLYELLKQNPELAGRCAFDVPKSFQEYDEILKKYALAGQAKTLSQKEYEQLCVIHKSLMVNMRFFGWKEAELKTFLA